MVHSGVLRSSAGGPAKPAGPGASRPRPARPFPPSRACAAARVGGRPPAAAPALPRLTGGLAVAGLSLLLAGRLLGQGPGPRLLRDTLPPGDPIAILLERGTELRLSPQQVSRLRTIQDRLHAANDSLVKQLVTIRHGVPGRGAIHPRVMSPEERAALHGAVQRARPLMQAIARNNVEAMREVGSTLSDDQKATVRTWLPQSAGAPGGPARQPAGQGRGPGRGRGGPPGGGHGRGASGAVGSAATDSASNR